VEKLTEPGRLYLKDYLILEEARKDMERFLNSVVDEAYDLIEEELEDLAPENFVLDLWQNESTKGQLYIRFKSSNDTNFDLFRANKSDITIKYKDIRNTIDLSDPIFVKIFAESPTVASGVEDRLKNMSLEEYDNDVYQPKYLRLNLDNSSKSAELIRDEVLNKCNYIRKLINFIQA